MLRILSSLFTLLLSVSAMATTVESYVNFVQVTPPLDKRVRFTVVDDKFEDPKEWATIESIHRVSNRVVFQVDEQSLRTQPDTAQTYTLHLSLTRWLESGKIEKESHSLQLTYNPDAKSTTEHQAILELEGALKMEIEVLSITTDKRMSFPDFMIYGEITVERSFIFDCAVSPSFDHNGTIDPFQIQANTGEILVSWPFLAGSEDYDLEWTFYDEQGEIGNAAGNLSNTTPYAIDDLFANNATRITTDQNQYRIKNLYPEGYLFFRIRGVRTLSDGTREHTTWSSTTTSSLYDFSDKLAVAWHEEDLNWQSSVVYAEEGKHKASISYFDGSLRNRQTATHLGGKKILSQSLYDHYGRPVIQTLPYPGFGQQALSFEPNILENPGVGSPYNRSSYTLENDEDSPVPMGEGNGPARYYGSDRFGGAAPGSIQTKDYFLPDAEGYPFSMTEYLPDHTGRIRRQSGVGATFKMGGGRETHYYYGKPGQEELDRMFGNDVGFNSHYLKNMVQDPNGQLSISYIDAHGRTIATALAGDVPGMVTELDPEAPEETITISLLNELEQNLISTYTLLVTNEGEHDFSYNLTTTSFQPDCLPADICYDCIYDVEITISDYSGNEFNGGEPLIIESSNYELGTPPVVDFSCASLGIEEDFVRTLPVGQYEITKRLRINQDGLQVFVEDYMSQTDCLPDYQDILDGYLAEVPEDCDYNTVDCLTDLGTKPDYIAQFAADLGVTVNELSTGQLAQAGVEYDILVAECELLNGLDDCAIYRQLLESDMYPTALDSTELDANDCPVYPPGGQYAWYTLDTNGDVVAFDEASIFALDENNSPRYAQLDFSPYTVNINGVDLSPAVLNPTVFVENFDPAWLEILVQLHPEYCYLEWCEGDNSRDFDRLLRETTSFADAVMPPNQLVGTDGLIYTYDPFFLPGGLGADCVAEIAAYYDHMDPDNPDSPALLDWIANVTYGPNCGIAFGMGRPAENDMAWQRLRGFYLGIKERIRQSKRPACCPGPIPGCENPGYNCSLTFEFLDDCSEINRVQLPLTVQGFVDITSFNLTVNYDEAEIVFTGAVSIIAGINPTDLNITDDSQGTLLISWSSTTPLTVVDGETLFELNLVPVTPNTEVISDVTFSSASASNSSGNLNPTDINTIGARAIFTADCTPDLRMIPQQDVCCKVLRLGTPDFPEMPDFVDALTELNETELAIQAAVATNCEDMREVWRQQLLAACADINNIEGILNDLVAICAAGGDAAHPNGASTTPIVFDEVSGWERLSINGFTSFAEVLSAAMGTSTCPDFNPYIINFPGPYEQVTYNGPRTIVSKANTCACDQLKTLDACYQFDNEGYSTFEEYLSQYSETNLNTDDLTMLLTACSAMSGDDQARFLPRPILLPPYLDCGVCQTCEDISPLIAAFKEETGNEDPTDPSYYAALTDYLNYHLGFNLEIEDYQDFLAECGTGQLTCRDAMLLCPNTPFDSSPNTFPDCMYEAVAAAEQQAQAAYEYQLAQLEAEFINAYLEHCNQTTETFTTTTELNEYHTTLYYYDQAGNLTKTVPPKGFHPITLAAELEQVKSYRNTGTGPAEFPEHTMITSYQYNSLRQIVAKDMPDVEETYYWYDELGRLIASQDGRQRGLSPERFSYTLYDPIGRVVEVGEIANSTDLGLGNTSDGTAVSYQLFELEVRESVYRYFITQTHYDVETDFYPTNLPEQENLRNRVATITFEDTYDGENSYDYATYYSYDITGNVKTLIQDLKEALVGTGHQWKQIDYDYDFLSGNVNAVHYQRGAADQFTHRYAYDEDNRLIEVHTSPVSTLDDIHSPVWEREAYYSYYDHGPLSRTVIGEREVQGMDYAYTIQGWIKGMNSSALVPEKDMGRDGAANSLQPGSLQNRNRYVAQDAFAYTLGYFSGDFSSASGSVGEFELTTIGTAFDDNPSLYNGNVRHMVMQSRGLSGGATGARYNYDQLHRIKTMESYGLEASISNYTWGSSLTSRGYDSDYTYDPNGNLEQLNRTANGVLMDQLTYNYADPDNSNLLLQVTDDTEDSAFPDDFDGQGVNNYNYDGAGNLETDTQSGSTLSWNPYGKVEQINFTGGTDGLPNRTTFFDYGPDQNRVRKSYLDIDANEVRSTYYVRDAQGNCLAVYERDALGTIHWQEQHLYGSSRLGLWRPGVSWAGDAQPANEPYFSDESDLQEGWKTYELSNHLGNVAATISDRKTAIDEDGNGEADYYEPIIRSASEYYPFGLTMTGRELNFDDYRFGFNGKEADTKDEWGSLTHYDYGFRIYNPSIARFLSVDPLAPDFPWYTPYQFAGNKPIFAIDLDGLEEDQSVSTKPQTRPITIPIPSFLISHPTPEEGGLSEDEYWRLKNTEETRGFGSHGSWIIDNLQWRNFAGENTLIAPYNKLLEDVENELATAGVLSAATLEKIRTIIDPEDDNKRYTAYIAERDHKKNAWDYFSPQWRDVEEDLVYPGITTVGRNGRYNVDDIQYQTFEPVAEDVNKGTARGIEQILIELNNNNTPYPYLSTELDNKVNSTSPLRVEYYTRKLEGYLWLEENEPTWRIIYHRPPSNSTSND